MFIIILNNFWKCLEWFSYGNVNYVQTFQHQIFFESQIFSHFVIFLLFDHILDSLSCWISDICIIEVIFYDWNLTYILLLKNVVILSSIITLISYLYKQDYLSWNWKQLITSLDNQEQVIRFHGRIIQWQL